MLRTRERSLLLDGLRPPAGYHLRRAIGTSYTLDLMALLTAPLAFTFFDAHDDDGDPVADPVALLEALRRHAEKITLFCQAGGIAVPAPDQKLLALLEGSVIEVQSPGEGGVFHPKVWVLAFESEGRPTAYRVLCLSRNLTFSRAWDTCLRLDGTLTDGDGEFARSGPLAELLLALPGLSTRPVSTELADDLHQMAAEIRRVDFAPPSPFTDFRVHNFGIGDGGGWPFPQRGRSLVVSPFLSRSTVRRLVRDHGLEVLISRPEALEEVGRTEESGILPSTCYVLSPRARLDAGDADEGGKEAQARQEHKPEDPASAADDIQLAGLHAKLFLFENGRRATLFTGSANATDAAFHRNVEVLVELVGKTRECGIKAFLGSGEDQLIDSLRSLLQVYSLPDAATPGDSVQEKLKREAQHLAHSLGAARLTATVHDADAEQRWDITLSGRLPAVPAGAEVRVWPATLPRDAAVVVDGPESEPQDRDGATGPGGAIATFRGVSFEALTAFFAFEVSLEAGGKRLRKRFSVTTELVGAPDDRIERVVRSILKNRRRVLQLLMLILMGEGADVATFLQAGRSDVPAGPQGALGGWSRSTLLEALLRSLSSNPKQLDSAARLISDLQKTSEGRDLLPEDLDAIWKPVWRAREALTS